MRHNEAPIEGTLDPGSHRSRETERPATDAHPQDPDHAEAHALHSPTPAPADTADPAQSRSCPTPPPHTGSIAPWASKAPRTSTGSPDAARPHQAMRPHSPHTSPGPSPPGRPHESQTAASCTFRPSGPHQCDDRRHRAKRAGRRRNQQEQRRTNQRLSHTIQHTYRITTEAARRATRKSSEAPYCRRTKGAIECLHQTGRDRKRSARRRTTRRPLTRKNVTLMPNQQTGRAATTTPGRAKRARRRAAQ